MPDDPGMVGYGATVEIKIGEGAFEQIEGIFDVVFPTPTVANPQSPSMNMPGNAMQRVPGKVIDYGQASFGLIWIPGSDADDLILSLVTLGTPFTVRETTPNGVTWTQSGLFASMTPAAPWDDRMTSTVTIDTTGAPTIGAAAVPVNSVKPTITGASVQVGVTLTGHPGKYTGGTTSFAYQWQHDASGNGTFANVSVGGTEATYVPVVGDIADFLRVGVTPTNSAGAGTTVYSLPVGPIIAA